MSRRGFDCWRFQTVRLAGTSIYLLHKLKDLDLDPKSAGVRIIVYGHTHQRVPTGRAGSCF